MADLPFVLAVVALGLTFTVVSAHTSSLLGASSGGSQLQRGTVRDSPSSLSESTDGSSSGGSVTNADLPVFVNVPERVSSDDLDQIVDILGPVATDNRIVERPQSYFGSDGATAMNEGMSSIILADSPQLGGGTSQGAPEHFPTPAQEDRTFGNQGDAPTPKEKSLPPKEATPKPVPAQKKPVKSGKSDKSGKSSKEKAAPMAEEEVQEEVEGGESEEGDPEEEKSEKKAEKEKASKKKKSGGRKLKMHLS